VIEDQIVPDLLGECFTETGLAAVCGKIFHPAVIYIPITDDFYVLRHHQYYESDTAKIVYYSITRIGEKLKKFSFQFNGSVLRIS
jgi:hypothetical protein